MRRQLKTLSAVASVAFLLLLFQVPVARAFQEVDVNDACGESATEGEECGLEDGSPTTEGTCQSIGSDLLICTATETGTSTGTEAAVVPTSEVLTPRFAINIPTISLGNVQQYVVDEERVTDSGTITERVTYTVIPWLADYISGAYRYAVFLGSLLAAVMMMIGGMQWLTAAGNSERVAAAKKRITNAVTGLILILGTYLLLFTINPNLTSLNPIRVRHVEPDVFEYVGSPPDSAPAPSGGDYVATANVEGSSGHRDSMFSVCVSSGATLDTLRQVLPVWVASGRQGAAVYVRGGWTGRTSCSWNATESWLRSHLASRRVTVPATGGRDVLGPIYEREVVTKIFADGRACGDCVSWTQQLFKCAGKGRIVITDMKTSSSQYLIATGATCREAAASVPGGLRFGDAFYSNNVGHMFTYTGGENLGYEIIEMGGRVTCRTTVPGVGGDAMACVSTHASKDAYFTWIDRPRRSNDRTGTTGGRRASGDCMVFRYIQ